MLVKEDHILQAAQQLFQKYGWQKVSMDDVAKAIGKSRSSLYYYYKSKEEIYAAVVNMEVDDIVDKIGQAVEQVTGTEEKIATFFTTKMHLMRKRRELYGSLEAGMNADEISSLSGIKRAGHARIMKGEGDLLKEILKQGVEAGELRPIPPREMENLVFVILANMHGLKREMLLAEDAPKIDTLAQTLSQLIVHGLKA
ncbi:TetR/AcrR family transcriptional regulator [Dinghuibacter silviterrae]|uniref:TetR family transcriptional regulator n=1 Tax=Dinghuibacter silviterrae TaxID=1539049 RepID=A0A4R8DU43_9BACT|nr:TetR/AcrR family transcriptional regulator [Dinghuibacter silviterrae]TDX01436.1 TetR family transcriptional regulator [Dinghuibacter silviterrae]